jgi:hypothetical protein
MKIQITLYFVIILISFPFKGNAVFEYKSSDEILQTQVGEQSKPIKTHGEEKTSHFKKRKKKKFQINWFNKNKSEKVEEKTTYGMAWLGLSLSAVGAIITLLLIIIGIGNLFWIAVLFAGAGLAFSIVSLVRSSRLESRKGRGLALAGVITGGTVLVFWIFILTILLLFLGTIL